jgi:hypothetical protein
MSSQLVFDADFWPALHIAIQTRLASRHNSAVPVKFYVDLAEALAFLGSYNLDMLRVDFSKYPVDPDNAMNNGRLASVGQSYAQLRWSLVGNQIVVSSIIWKNI